MYVTEAAGFGRLNHWVGQGYSIFPFELSFPSQKLGTNIVLSALHLVWFLYRRRIIFIQMLQRSSESLALLYFSVKEEKASFLSSSFFKRPRCLGKVKPLFTIFESIRVISLDRSWSMPIRIRFFAARSSFSLIDDLFTWKEVFISPFLCSRPIYSRKYPSSPLGLICSRFAGPQLAKALSQRLASQKKYHYLLISPQCHHITTFLIKCLSWFKSMIPFRWSLHQNSQISQASYTVVNNNCSSSVLSSKMLSFCLLAFIKNQARRTTLLLVSYLLLMENSKYFYWGK